MTGWGWRILEGSKRASCRLTHEWTGGKQEGLLSPDANGCRRRTPRKERESGNGGRGPAWQWVEMMTRSAPGVLAWWPSGARGKKSEGLTF